MTVDLQRLVDPVDRDRFLTDYWEKKPLIVQRSADSYFQALLSLADLDGILAHSSIRSSDIRVVQNGEETPVKHLMGAGSNQAAGGIEALYQRYRQGSTIVVQFLHERWGPLKALCQALNTELSASAQVNVYLTPPNARGFQTHYDTHDVFVLQTHGKKRWRIYPPPLWLPLADQPYRSADAKPPGDPVFDVVLRAGDCIYLPRGYLHDAMSLEETSLHLTVGIQPVTWASVVLAPLQDAIRADPLMRESLPVGFARDDQLQRESEARLQERLRSVVEKLVSAELIANVVGVAKLARHPSLDGHLRDLDAVEKVTATTRVCLREGLVWDMRVAGEQLTVTFHGKDLGMPAHAEAAVRFIDTTGTFTPQELPGLVDTESKLVLVRRLLREGFLTINRGA